MVIPIPWLLTAVKVVRFYIKKCRLILQNGPVIAGIFVKVSTLDFRMLYPLQICVPVAETMIKAVVLDHLSAPNLMSGHIVRLLAVARRDKVNSI